MQNGDSPGLVTIRQTSSSVSPRVITRQLELVEVFGGVALQSNGQDLFTFYDHRGDVHVNTRSSEECRKFTDIGGWNTHNGGRVHLDKGQTAHKRSSC